MTLIKEPKTVDFYIQSKPWTEGELKELSEIIRKARQTIVPLKRGGKRRHQKRLKSSHITSPVLLYTPSNIYPLQHRVPLSAGGK